MIIATIKMKVIAEKRSELLQTLRSMTEEIRTMKGCSGCYFYHEVDNENIIIIIEEWNTQGELDNHLKSDIFSALIGTNSLLIEPADISINTVSHTAGMEAVKNARDMSSISNEKKERGFT